MQITQDNGNATYKINRYKNGCFVVNNRTYSDSIVVMPEHLLFPWGPNAFETLAAEHFDLLLPYKLQLVLVGTGTQLRFPNQKFFASLINQKTGIEVMDTAAACRTYTLLMAEGRKVAAALLC